MFEEKFPDFQILFSLMKILIRRFKLPREKFWKRQKKESNFCWCSNETSWSWWKALCIFVALLCVLLAKGKHLAKHFFTEIEKSKQSENCANVNHFLNSVSYLLGHQKQFTVTKIKNAATCEIFAFCFDEQSIYYLHLKSYGADANHVICIFLNMIFEASFEHALIFNKSNVDTCTSGLYESLIRGCVIKFK